MRECLNLRHEDVCWLEMCVADGDVLVPAVSLLLHSCSTNTDPNPPPHLNQLSPAPPPVVILPVRCTDSL